MVEQLIDVAPRDGDVYRFVYSVEEYAKVRPGGDLLWCFDGQLIYRAGILYDTYWGMEQRGDSGRRFTVAEAQQRGTLTLKCNLSDVEKIQDYEFPLYAEGDAFNLSHQHGCYKFFVRRKGAKKDKALMLAALDAKVAEAKRKIESATWELEYTVRRRAELTPRIEAGEEITV